MNVRYLRYKILTICILYTYDVWMYLKKTQYGKGSF